MKGPMLPDRESSRLWMTMLSFSEGKTERATSSPMGYSSSNSLSLYKTGQSHRKSLRPSGVSYCHKRSASFAFKTVTMQRFP